MFNKCSNKQIEFIYIYHSLPIITGNYPKQYIIKDINVKRLKSRQLYYAFFIGQTDARIIVLTHKTH